MSNLQLSSKTVTLAMIDSDQYTSIEEMAGALNDNTGGRVFPQVVDVDRVTDVIETMRLGLQTIGENVDRLVFFQKLDAGWEVVDHSACTVD